MSTLIRTRLIPSDFCLIKSGSLEAYRIIHKPTGKIVQWLTAFEVAHAVHVEMDWTAARRFAFGQKKLPTRDPQ